MAFTLKLESIENIYTGHEYAEQRFLRNSVLCQVERLQKGDNIFRDGSFATSDSIDPCSNELACGCAHSSLPISEAVAHDQLSLRYCERAGMCHAYNVFRANHETVGFQDGGVYELADGCVDVSRSGEKRGNGGR